MTGIMISTVLVAASRSPPGGVGATDFATTRAHLLRGTGRMSAWHPPRTCLAAFAALFVCGTYACEGRTCTSYRLMLNHKSRCLYASGQVTARLQGCMAVCARPRDRLQGADSYTGRGGHVPQKSAQTLATKRGDQRGDHWPHVSGDLLSRTADCTFRE